MKKEYLINLQMKSWVLMTILLNSLKVVNHVT